MVGPGPWSPIAVFKAATVPAPPEKPYYIGSTDDSITLGLLESVDNGGSEIIRYELFRDEGDLSSPVNVKVSDYAVGVNEVTVTGLTSGQVYRFTLVAVNDFSSSDPSLILTVACSALPDPPIDVTIDWTKSTKTELVVQWSAPASQPASLITGYLLEANEGFEGSKFVQVYDGTEDNNNLRATVKVENGLLYTFRAYAINFNGKS